MRAAAGRVAGAAAALGALALAGCAKSADQVSAAYVSPMQFQSYNCQQLAQEAERISARAVALTGTQNRQAASDAVVTAVAVVIFWPAAFMVGGDNAQTAELARLKGEMEAIEQVSIHKKCGIVFRTEEGKS
ncbi:hypothetical protein [Xanthobacter tagetidis]|uniref:hypothetical protein n=1 Tax=Xanthobacter tagetidis TaxID=60216 RepID=UPI001853A66F|nr:hypothetical protein [Xanthobacter tagetidis]MBB6308149.1 hypothetical protein [Xanthobacter tagetidis]